MGDVMQIVQEYLAVNEFDGLWNEENECSCVKGDLAPGWCLSESCKPGYLQPCPEDCGEHSWHIGAKRGQDATT